jgi:hypothetical protein
MDSRVSHARSWTCNWVSQIEGHGEADTTLQQTRTGDIISEDARF